MCRFGLFASVTAWRVGQRGANLCGVRRGEHACGAAVRVRAGHVAAVEDYRLRREIPGLLHDHGAAFALLLAQISRSSECSTQPWPRGFRTSEPVLAVDRAATCVADRDSQAGFHRRWLICGTGEHVIVAHDPGSRLWRRGTAHAVDEVSGVEARAADGDCERVVWASLVWRHSLVAGDVRVNEKHDQATVRIDRRGSDDLVVEACRQLRVDPQPAWAAYRAWVGSVSYVMGEVLQDIMNGSSMSAGDLGCVR